MSYAFTVQKPNLLTLTVQGYIDDPYIEMLCVETRRMLDTNPQRTGLLIDGCAVAGIRVTAWQSIERVICHPHLKRLALVLNHEQFLVIKPFLNDMPELMIFESLEEACDFLHTPEPQPGEAAGHIAGQFDPRQLSTRSVVVGGFERELFVEEEYEQSISDDVSEPDLEEPLIRYYGERGLEAVYTVDGKPVERPDCDAPVINVLNAATTTLNGLARMVHQAARRIESVANSPK